MSATAARVAEHYREAFIAHRAGPDFHEPLFPGARGVFALALIAALTTAAAAAMASLRTRLHSRKLRASRGGLGRRR